MIINIGNFITERRIELNVSQEQLCEGLYGRSFLSMVETDERMTSKTLISNLLERLELCIDGFEFYLTAEEEDIENKFYEIKNLINENNFEVAKAKLKLYEKKLVKDNLNKQVYLLLQIRIMQAENQNILDILNKLKEAILITIPRFEKISLTKLLLSTKELVVILEYLNLKAQTSSIDDMIASYNDFLRYIKMHKNESSLKSQMFAQSSSSIAKLYLQQNNYKKAVCICNNAINYVGAIGRIDYICELLNLKAIALENRIKTNIVPQSKKLLIDLQNTKEQYQILNNLCDEHKIIKDNIKNYTDYFLKQTHNIGYVIKCRREMLGLSQEELADGILSKKALSATENNKSAPHKKSVRSLFERLNLPSDLLNNGIVTNNYHMHKIDNTLSYNISIHDYSDVGNLLLELKNNIDMNDLTNKQNIAIYEIIIKNRTQQINNQEKLNGLKEALSITMPINGIFKKCNKFFSKKEIIIINNIIITLEELKQYDEMLKWAKVLEDYYDKDERFLQNNIITYEFSACNLASIFGNQKQYKKSNEISQKALNHSLQASRAVFLPNLIYNYAWNVKTEIEETRTMTFDEQKKYMTLIKESYILSYVIKCNTLKSFFRKELKCFSDNII